MFSVFVYAAAIENNIFTPLDYFNELFWAAILKRAAILGIVNLLLMYLLQPSYFDTFKVSTLRINSRAHLDTHAHIDKPTHKI